MNDIVELGKRILPEPDEDGFEPTNSLRIFGIGGIGGVLQQCWRKPKLNRWGHVTEWEYEWRQVPHVYG